MSAGSKMYESQATADVLLMRLPTGASEADQEPVEALLVKAVLAGERDRFGQLYDRYAPMVHGILLARVPRIAGDDLVQDIFLHSLRKVNTLQDPKTFEPRIA